MDFLMSVIKAFVIGGLLCIVGQILIDITKMTPARILVTFVVAGVVLSAIGVYKPLVDFAGCGATIPLTGFGHLLAEGVKEKVLSNGWIGVLTGGLTATAGGIAASIFFGYLAALLGKPKDKS